MARLALRLAVCLMLAVLAVKADDLTRLLDDILRSDSGGAASYGSSRTLREDPYGSSQVADVGYESGLSSIYGKSAVDSIYGKEGYGYSNGYDSQPSAGYQQQQQSYGYQQQPSYGYGQQGQGHGQQPASYGYGQQRQEYGYKPKVKKVYVPVVAKKKKKKKMKIISVQKGFYIAGGTQLFGKYKSLKACERACAATPNCFAGDYNPWFQKCYIHSNYTACGTLRAHKKLVHFKKVPCSFPEAPTGRVMLGVQIFQGLEQKAAKSLSDCLKLCATAGDGIRATANDIQDQVCYGIDYDFGSHKCFFHVDNNYPAYHFCPVAGTAPGVPRDTVPNPSVVSILLCPGPYV